MLMAPGACYNSIVDAYGWDVGARFIATLSGGQVIGRCRPRHHPQGWRTRILLLESQIDHTETGLIICD